MAKPPTLFKPKDYGDNKMAWTAFKMATKLKHIYNYYNVIVKLRQNLIDEVKETSQVKVAEQINMSQSELSHLMNILVILED